MIYAIPPTVSLKGTRGKYLFDKKFEDAGRLLADEKEQRRNIGRLLN